MTKKKVAKAIAAYRTMFEKTGVPKKKCPPDIFPQSDEDFLAHCHYMLDQMEAFLQAGRIEKAGRWLGFVQGCLWRAKIATFEDSKNTNRP